LTSGCGFFKHLIKFKSEKMTGRIFRGHKLGDFNIDRLQHFSKCYRKYKILSVARVYILLLGVWCIQYAAYCMQHTVCSIMYAELKIEISKKMGYFLLKLDSYILYFAK
jgi:hypothetical protein